MHLPGIVKAAKIWSRCGAGGKKRYFCPCMETKYLPLCRISHRAAVIPAGEYAARCRDVVRFEGYCRECSNYGTLWSCPPFDGEAAHDPEAFGWVYVSGTVITPSAELVGGVATPERVREVSYAVMREIRALEDPRLLHAEALVAGSRAFFAGPCLLCPQGKCMRRRGLTCPTPQLVRPPLEAVGYDIGMTCSDVLGIELKWGAADRLPEYFTFVGALMTPGPLPAGIASAAGLPEPGAAKRQEG